MLLQVAREFKDEPRFYFPHNLDFRGRAYPIHPHLNHMGPDICRGLLTFANARPLGPDGLGWLYVMVQCPPLTQPCQRLGCSACTALLSVFLVILLWHLRLEHTTGV